MKPQILVIGYSAEHCTKKAYRIAYEVGQEVAQQGAILITGGLGGVMEAASKGASETGGLVVSIIPQDEKSWANKYLLGSKTWVGRRIKDKETGKLKYVQVQKPVTFVTDEETDPLVGELMQPVTDWKMKYFDPVTEFRGSKAGWRSEDLSFSSYLDKINFLSESPHS